MAAKNIGVPCGYLKVSNALLPKDGCWIKLGDLINGVMVLNRFRRALHGRQDKLVQNVRWNERMPEEQRFTKE